MTNRGRSQTIGTLGKGQARTSGKMPVQQPEPPPVVDRGWLRRWIHGALFDNLLLKFLSMVLAVTVFLLVNTDKDNDITVPAALVYDYPQDKVLVSEEQREVRVTIKGPWRRLKEFDERSLGQLHLDLSNAPTGEVPIPKSIVKLPPGLSVKDISPRSVRVAFDRRVEKVVEIVPVTQGRPQHGYILAEMKAAPATVKVRGGERLLAAISTVRTNEISLEGRTDSFEQLCEIVPSDGVVVSDPTLRIAVSVRIEEELVTRKNPGMVVVVKGEGAAFDPTKWSVTPPQVEVSLTGALLAVEKARIAMTPIVKLTANDRNARDVEVTIEGLPPGVGIRVSPERVKVTPVR